MVSQARDDAREMEDRIADAEAEVARAQAHLEALRRQAGETAPSRPDSPADPSPDAVPRRTVDAPVPSPAEGAGRTGQTKASAGIAHSDASSSPDDIVDAIAAESEAEARGNRGSEAAAAVLYEEAPFVPAKDHVAAALLAILLGCFGIHKFYLGYTTAGFITLGITIVGGVFTLGIAAAVMALVGIVEGVLYLTESQSKFESTHVAHTREWF